MKTVKVKNLIIGEGMPKICVPITGKTKEEIIEEAESLIELNADIAEWRADWFHAALSIDKINDVLRDLVVALKGIPLLFTFRTSNEGGMMEISPKEYAQLNKAVIDAGYIDLLDVEVFIGDDIARDIIERAQKGGVKVIASYHDFYKTPPKEEIIERLRKMQDIGADILKIAVMPKSKIDVLELMKAAVIMEERYADRPIAAMSMSSMGVISRLAGETFGSALTFAAGKKASAPGQVSADNLHKALQSIHACIKEV